MMSSRSIRGPDSFVGLDGVGNGLIYPCHAPDARVLSRSKRINVVRVGAPSVLATMVKLLPALYLAVLALVVSLVGKNGSLVVGIPGDPISRLLVNRLEPFPAWSVEGPGNLGILNRGLPPVVTEHEPHGLSGDVTVLPIGYRGDWSRLATAARTKLHGRIVSDASRNIKRFVPEVITC
jgi:hypothetical protein